MVNRLIPIGILSCLMVAGCVAQTRPKWADRVEERLAREVPDLKTDYSTFADKEGWLFFSFGGTYRGAGGHMSIQYLGNVSNVPETFGGYVTIFNNGAAHKSAQVEGYGTQAYVWSGMEPGSWNRLYFLRGKFIVDITWPRPVAEKVGKIVDEEISKI